MTIACRTSGSLNRSISSSLVTISPLLSLTTTSVSLTNQPLSQQPPLPKSALQLASYLQRSLAIRTFIIILWCLILLGCATQSQQERIDSFKYNHNVLKENWTVEDYNHDHEQCQKHAQRLVWFVYKNDTKKLEEIYRQCMEEERGWRVK